MSRGLASRGRGLMAWGSGGAFDLDANRVTDPVWLVWLRAWLSSETLPSLAGHCHSVKTLSSQCTDARGSAEVDSADRPSLYLYQASKLLGKTHPAKKMPRGFQRACPAPAQLSPPGPSVPVDSKPPRLETSSSHSPPPCSCPNSGKSRQLINCQTK